MDLAYYGELKYQFSCKYFNIVSLSWLFIDFDSFRNIAFKYGWNFEPIFEDDNIQFK